MEVVIVLLLVHIVDKETVQWLFFPVEHDINNENKYFKDHTWCFFYVFQPFSLILDRF